VDGRCEVPAVAVRDVVGVPGVGRLDDEHRLGSGPLRSEDEWCIDGVAVPAEPRDVVAARPARAESNMNAPTRPAGGTGHRSRCGHSLSEQRPVPAEGRCRGRGRAAREEELERDAAGRAAADVEHGSLAGRVAACFEPGQKRCGSGAARAEHDAEHDREGGRDCEPGTDRGQGRTLSASAQEFGEPWLMEWIGRRVHAATVGDGSNRGLTAG